MPALPSPGNVVKYEYNYGKDDVQATNIFYFSYTGASGLSLSELEAFAVSTQMGDIAAPYVGASTTDQVSMESKMTDLSSDVGPTYSFTPGWTGTNMGENIPANAAVVVSHEILRRYRGGHPRTYMMAGTAGDFVSGSIRNWQASFLSNIQAGFSAFAADFPFTLGARTWQWVNVSYWETVGGVRTLRTTPLVDVVISAVARDRICTQRRRLGKVGG